MRFMLSAYVSKAWKYSKYCRKAFKNNRNSLNSRQWRPCLSPTLAKDLSLAKWYALLMAGLQLKRSSLCKTSLIPLSTLKAISLNFRTCKLISHSSDSYTSAKERYPFPLGSNCPKSFFLFSFASSVRSQGSFSLMAAQSIFDILMYSNYQLQLRDCLEQ